MDATGHQQLGDRIAGVIRTRIVEGEMSPGEWLRQEHLAREFGVSQGSVRDALRKLAAEGLVEHVPYRGTRIVQVAEEDAADLFACRAFAEARLARFAASNITDEELEELRRLRAKMTESIRADRIEEYQRLNRSFHELIINASRRPFLQQLLNKMWLAHPTMLWPNFRKSTRATLAARFIADEAEHDAIVRALSDRDPDASERAMKQHIEVSVTMLLDSVRTKEER